MFAGVEKRKCLKCGNEFINIRGGIIFKLFPTCPVCGSPLNVKLKGLL